MAFVASAPIPIPVPMPRFTNNPVFCSAKYSSSCIVFILLFCIIWTDLANLCMNYALLNRELLDRVSWNSTTPWKPNQTWGPFTKKQQTMISRKNVKNRYRHLNRKIFLSDWIIFSLWIYPVFNSSPNKSNKFFKWNYVFWKKSNLTHFLLKMFSWITMYILIDTLLMTLHTLFISTFKHSTFEAKFWISQEYIHDVTLQYITYNTLHTLHMFKVICSTETWCNNYDLTF